ncbi:hypothetical protein [Streptomyces sp. NPDC003299]
MTPLEGAAVVAGLAASGLPLGALAARTAARRIPRRDPESRRARARAQADRDLLRLARNTRKDRTTVKPDHLAATEDEMRDPDFCWTCGRKCGSQAHR